MKADPKTTKLLLLAMVTTAAMAWTGCDSHDEGNHATDGGAHSSPYPACGEIAAACHQYDVGDGPIHDCHDAAHAAKSEADCTPIKDNCLAICAAAGADSGASGSDAGDGG